MSFNVFERQADEYAVFYCHISGYHTVQIGSAVLDSIYQKFHLTDKKLKKYPPLIERKEIVQNSELKMKALCMMHDDGLLALANGNISCAKGLFKEILDRQFTSREIYNNYGLCSLLEVINEIDTVSYPYSFPVQFDFQTNLNLSSERSLGEDERDKLLRAVENFTKATSGTDDYYIGHLNKAISYFLLEDYAKMNSELEYSIKSQDRIIQESVRNIRAIYLHKIGESKEARKILKSYDLTLLSSTRNLAVIEGGKKNHKENRMGKKTAVVDNALNQLLDSLNLFSYGIQNLDFSSNSALTAGRETLKPLGEGLGVKLRIIDEERMFSRRWVVNGNTLTIYQPNYECLISELYWKDLKSQANSTFESNNTDVLVFDSFVLKKVNNQVFLYKIK
jgi:tetratricopeptide (TPR) repeat protein